MAFRFIAANDHPDHDTIASFRRRFLAEIEGLLKLDTVALGGTKVRANASRYRAQPWFPTPSPAGFQDACSGPHGPGDNAGCARNSGSD